jgi:hypothetical protein
MQHLEVAGFVSGSDATIPSFGIVAFSEKECNTNVGQEVGPKVTRSSGQLSIVSQQIVRSLWRPGARECGSG